MTTPKSDAPHPFTASQADAFLSGQSAPSDALAEISPVLDALRAAADVPPEPLRVDAMATQLALAAAEAAPVGEPAREHAATHQRSPVMKARTRIASVAGVALALAVGSAGVAAAAEDALPGDPLYTVKLTLEDIGVFEGGLDERVEESLTLAEQGDEDEALDHLADALEEEGEEESAEELRNAAEAVLSGGSEQSLAVRTAVSEMLQWMADTDLTGREFGQAVAERARAINGEKHDAPVDGEPVEGEPVEGEDAGKPDGAGKPEDAGKPEGTGKPDGAGPPEGAGKPDKAAKPSKR